VARPVIAGRTAEPANLQRRRCGRVDPVDLVDVVVGGKAEVVVVRVVVVVVTAVVEVVVTAPGRVADGAAVSSPLRHPPANNPTMAMTGANFPDVLLHTGFDVRRARTVPRLSKEMGGVTATVRLQRPRTPNLTALLRPLRRHHQVVRRTGSIPEARLRGGEAHCGGRSVPPSAQASPVQ